TAVTASAGSAAVNDPAARPSARSAGGTSHSPGPSGTAASSSPGPGGTGTGSPSTVGEAGRAERSTSRIATTARWPAHSSWWVTPVGSTAMSEPATRSATPPMLSHPSGTGAATSTVPVTRYGELN